MNGGEGGPGVAPPDPAAEINRLQEELARGAQEVARYRFVLDQRNQELEALYRTPGYHIIQKLGRLADQIAPRFTLRRSLLLAVIRAVEYLLDAGPVAFLARLGRFWVWLPRIFREARQPDSVSSNRSAGRRRLHVPLIGLRAGLFRGIQMVRMQGFKAFFVRFLKVWLWLPRIFEASSTSNGMKTQYFADVVPLRLPDFPDPEVSIIIPVYNKAEFTYNCLKFIEAHTNGPSYEVIVVDDCSNDSTSQMLRKIENVRVVRNGQNLGFLETCNHGAGFARGRYIVLLNNDTQVQPGWLAALVGTIKRDDQIGLVGAKLVYPDGRLQEAGGIIWQDASGWNYGRLQDPAAPEFNFVRDVDYCSGACILVRRDLWEEFGGFDRRFGPAYFEDTDLAFQIRERGLRVVYQPRAEVVHFEGISHGTDVSSGIKRFQEINRTKFIEKWALVLAKEHLANGQQPYRARCHGAGASILVIDNFVPTPDRDSGSLRMFSILRLLRDLGYAVTFLPFNRARTEPYTSQLQDYGIEVLYGPIDLKSYLGRDPGRFKIAIVSRADVADHFLPLLREATPATRVVFDTVDLHFLREERRAKVERSRNARSSAERYRKLELSLVAACDATIAISQEEKAILEEEAPGSRVYVVPNIHSTENVTRRFGEREGLLFVGNFSHSPNRDAVIYFVQKIFPRILKELGPLKLKIVGAEAGPEIKRLANDNVVVTGWVPDLSSYYNSARVFVAPLRFGAGMNGKIGQSMSFGLPVVTTPLGAEGLGANDGDEVLIAEEPEAFAAKVSAAYKDEAVWQRLSTASRRFVADHYTPEVVRESLRGLLAEQSTAVEVSTPPDEGNLASAAQGFSPEAWRSASL